MTLRLGFVGVGKWAQKLATAFRACGAEIVAYDRSSPKCGNCLVSLSKCTCSLVSHPSGFGLYCPWRDQLTDPSIDAIVAVAPPEITTEVALACAAAGKAVCATKPLFDHPETIRAPFYVDFWRLWSEAHQYRRRRREFEFCGQGPMRSFHGLFDYGPHVMAAVLDVAPEAKLISCAPAIGCEPGELVAATFSVDGEEVRTLFGNGAHKSIRNIWGWAATGEEIGHELKSAVLQRFCQSFLNDISEGFVDTRLLRLSRDGMRELRKIREMAMASDPTRR